MVNLKEEKRTICLCSFRLESLLATEVSNIDGFIQVEDNICKFAKKGLTPSQIGVILRDSHGIAQVNSVTGSKILRILKGHGMHLHLFYSTFLLFCTKVDSHFLIF